MPTELPKRPQSQLKFILIVVAVFIFLSLFQWAFPGRKAHAEHHIHHTADMAPGPPELSYYGYMHDEYHTPFYSKLTKIGGGSCCSGHECRPTEPLRGATPEFTAMGFNRMVKVDGDWYPIKLQEKITGFTSEQIAEAKQNPRYKEFLQLTHVCAAKIAPPPAVRADPVQFRMHQLNKASSIYCVLDGGDKG